MSEKGGIHIDQHDPYGKTVGVLAAILAVLLSFFTILAHRTHTATIILQNESNDQWSRYQAKRIRDYQLEMNLDLLKFFPANSESSTLIKTYSDKHNVYHKELDEIKKEAEIKVHESQKTEKKALYFDFSEGVIEIALVMSSLYFIARKKLFPIFGIFFGLFGIVIGLLGLFA